MGAAFWKREPLIQNGRVEVYEGGQSKGFAPCKPYAPNQIDYGKKNVEINSGTAIFSVFFYDSIITLEKITTCSWNDCE